MTKDNYYEPRFYPLVKADDSGKDLAPMFRAADYKECEMTDKPYISEIIAHVFRAHNISAGTKVRCPYCESVLKQIADDPKKAIYICPNCGI